MKLRTWQKDFLKGSALGTGILPGVSVGTVGFIVDIYEKLITSLAGLKSRKTFKKSFIDLLPIAIGCLIFTLLFIVFWKKVAYVLFPFVTISVLAGFVIGGMPIMINELRGAPLKRGDVIRMAIGFTIAASIGICSYFSAAGIINVSMDFYMEFFDPFSAPWIYALVLAMGFFSAVACLIPGISGSMVMYIFALFNPILTIFISDKDGKYIAPGHASIFETQENLWPRLLILVVLLLGMLVGFISVSVAMKKLLAEHRRGTFGCVIGFVAGSVVSMFFNNEMYNVYATPNENTWWQYVIGVPLGIGMAFLTIHLVKKAEKRKAAEEAASQKEEHA